MTTRLGFVGVGRHAQRMARAFRDCGAEVVAYDRASGSESLPLSSGFGERRQWREMVDSRAVDALVCCAPPKVTLEVAEACRARKTRLCATKPLLWTEADLMLPIWVDLWRLYSPAWRALKAEVGGRTITSCDIVFAGSGPARETHSGLLDYGPHALAFALDLGLPVDELKWERRAREWLGEDERLTVFTGNESKQRQMSVTVRAGKTYTWQESDTNEHSLDLYDGDMNEPVMGHTRDLALREFCRAFLRGEQSDTLRYSCDAMRVLLAVDAPAAKTKSWSEYFKAQELGTPVDPTFPWKR